VPVDMLGMESPATPPAAGEAEARKPLPALSAEAALAFKETLQHSSISLDEKVKVHHALQRICTARARGGAEAGRAARQQAFASLTPAGMKLALQLGRQLGSREVPVLRDEEFVAKRGYVGTLHEADRRFIVDRREYDRTIQAHVLKHKLDPKQIESAVMAARAYVGSEGRKQILLISKGEKALAEALTRIIRVARTRERASGAPVPPAAAAAYAGPERRTTEAEVQRAIDQALAQSGLDADRRDKVVRAFRLIHRTLGGSYDPAQLKELIRRGIFVGFSRAEIGLVERIMKIRGYPIG
jgi:hypothetical protein